MDRIRQAMGASVLAALLVAAPSAIGAATFEVKVKCDGLWDVIVELMDDATPVGSTQLVCNEEKVKTTIEVAEEDIVNAASILASGIEAHCEYDREPGISLAVVAMKCKGEVEDTEGAEFSEKIHVKIELDDEDGDDE